MLNFQLDVSLRFLRGNYGGFGLVEISAGYQLNQLLVRLKFLLHQRLHGWFFGLEDLPDLGTLIVGQVELVQRQSESGAAHKFSVHPMMHGAWASLFPLPLRESCARSER